jgi:hypothetical protein
MSVKTPNDQFDEEETKRRFEAALRGARAVGPHPMKEIPPKRPKTGATRRKYKTVWKEE